MVSDRVRAFCLQISRLLCLSQAVDYESRSSYSFSVEVLNPIVDPRFLRRGPFKDRASIRVAVLDADEPPRFARARYHMDVSENCPPACTVGRVSAVDPDTGLTNNIRCVRSQSREVRLSYRCRATLCDILALRCRALAVLSLLSLNGGRLFSAFGCNGLKKSVSQLEAAVRAGARGRFGGGYTHGDI